MMKIFCDRVDFSVLTSMIDGKIVKVQIWDTGGGESFQSITRGLSEFVLKLLIIEEALVSKNG